MARTGMFATLAALALASVAEAQMMAPPMYNSGTSTGRTRLFGGLRARRNQQVVASTPGTVYQQPVAGTVINPTTTGPIVTGTSPVVGGTPIVYGTGMTTPVIYRTTTPIVYGGSTMNPIVYGTSTTGPIVYGTPTTGPITGGIIVGGVNTTPTMGYTPMTTIPGTYAGATTTAPTFQPATTPGYGSYRTRLLRRNNTRTTNPIATAPGTSYYGGTYIR